MSEGITPEDAERFYPPELKEGDSGKAVEQMQNLLTIIAYFDNSIPLPAMNGVFDARTKNSLTAFQTQYRRAYSTGKARICCFPFTATRGRWRRKTGNP